MKTATVSGTIATVLGETLDTPIAFTAEYETFENPQEAKDAGEWPNDSEILKVVNTKRAANARQQKTQELTKEYAAKIQETPEYKRRQLAKAISASNPSLSAAQVEGMVSSILGS